jgi:outer membrane protein
MNKTLLSTAIVSVLALTSASALAHKAGDMLVRVGLTNVAPDASSSDVILGGANTGLRLDVDSNTQLGLNFAYFLTDNWNIEVLAATPFKHDIEIVGVGPLGETTHLPPTVTANYFFLDDSSAFQPYAGIGLNYTIFFDEGFTDASEAGGFADLDLDASFGLSAQLGFDYMLNDEWFINASARYIDISTDATFTAGGAPGSVTVDIDPYVYTLSVGYKF